MSMTGERTDSDLVLQLRDLYRAARDTKRPRYNVWIRNYGIVNNRAPGKAVASSTGNGWMPNPQDSEVYPTCSSLVGWMTDQNTQCHFIPAVDPNSSIFDFYSKLSNDLTTVVRSAWENEDYTQQIKLTIWDALIYGVGILKTVWDAGASGGYGDAKIIRVDPYSFYPDPNCSSLEDAEYFVEARYMSYEEIERKYPDTAWHLEEKPLGGSSETIDTKPDLYSETYRAPKANPGALPGGQVRYGQAKDGKDWIKDKGYVVYEYWLKENSEYFDNYDDLPENMHPEMSERVINTDWRVVVVCEDVVLFDEYADELWSYSSHPYDRFVFDDIGEFYGIALVDHLSHPQIYINRLLTAMQHNAELVGNPIFLEAANSGLARTAIINRPGQRLTLTGSGAMQNNRPDWLQPPSMPPAVMQLVQFWISRIESISGLSALVKGATPTNRNAEGVISSIQEAAFVRIRSALRNMEQTLERSISKVADLIIDNYNEPRMLAILGEDGQPTTVALSADHFMVPTRDGKSPLKYSLNVEAGSNSPTSRQARIAEADALFGLGAYDDVEVLKAHQVANYMQIIQRKDDRLRQGLFQPPGKRQAAGRSR